MKISLTVIIIVGLIGGIVAVRQVFTCCTDFGALTFAPSLMTIAVIVLLGLVAWRNT